VIAEAVKGNPRGSGYVRNAHDWYQEPRRAIDALLDVETFEGVTWDPACGSGNIATAFTDRGMAAFGSDIVDRGYGPRNDFRTSDWQPHHTIENIVTNPPFNAAVDFLNIALNIATEKVAILQRLSWLEGKARRQIFENTPLARVWVFSSRISMPPGGSDQPAKGGSVAFAWFCWDRSYRGPPTLGWLP
jgi:hypothetical protein